MGGVWSQPLKLVDGVWFGIDGKWLAPATKFTSGWGYTRMDFPRRVGAEGQPHRLRARRPPRARCSACELAEPGGPAKTVDVKVDAHSEVMSHYPWAWTTPNAGDFNLADTGALQRRRARVPRHGHAAPQRRAARLGGARRLEHAGRAAARPAPATGARRARRSTCTAESQFWCDEGPFGKGTGGQLRYTRERPGARRAHAVGRRRRLRQGRRGAARSELQRALDGPGRRARRQGRLARAPGAHTRELSLPGDRAPRQGHRVGQAEHRSTSRSAPTT